MPRDYDYYDPLSSTFDPYTSAPNYQYLFTDPSGMRPNSMISSQKGIVGEEVNPGPTGAYDSLPPPPTRFGITTSEAFESSEPSNGKQQKNEQRFGVNIDLNTIVIIILAFLLWIMVLRTNKIIKVMKKIRKGSTAKTGSRESNESDEDEYDFF